MTLEAKRPERRASRAESNSIRARWHSFPPDDFGSDRVKHVARTSDSHAVRVGQRKHRTLPSPDRRREALESKARNASKDQVPPASTSSRHECRPTRVFRAVSSSEKACTIQEMSPLWGNWAKQIAYSFTLRRNPEQLRTYFDQMLGSRRCRLGLPRARLCLVEGRAVKLGRLKDLFRESTVEARYCSGFTAAGYSELAGS
jgi:hypothetical protein